MKFLKKSKRWMKAHWQNKSFRIFLAVNILLVVLLSVENMLLFSAGVLKMLRYVILLCGVAVIACIDRRSKRIPNEILLALVYIRALVLIAECVMYPSYALSMIISALLGSILVILLQGAVSAWVMSSYSLWQVCIWDREALWR